jgi:hypothetical protein
VTIHDQVTLSQAPEGPLAAHLISFADAIGAKGYSAQSMQHQLRIAAGFSRWLKQAGVDLKDICDDHAYGIYAIALGMLSLSLQIERRFGVSLIFCEVRVWSLARRS